MKTAPKTRGEIIYKILDFLEDRTLGAADFITAILKAGYGASLSGLEYEHSVLNRQREKYQLDRQKRRDLQKYLFKLKKDGLILEDSKNEISISLKGKRKLHLLKRNKLLDKNAYKKDKGDRVIIVSYDIPLVFNKERSRLRDALKALGFNMVHQSVWVGKVKLPKKFIVSLRDLGILKYIEILEVTKSGSLKEF